MDTADYWALVEKDRVYTHYRADDLINHVHEWFQADTVDSYRVCLTCGLQERIEELED